MEQELGDGWTEGVHPDDLVSCIDIYVTAFDRRERFNMDYRLKHHDGTYRWIQDEGVPRYDTAGNFIGYLGHCIDITQRIVQRDLLIQKEKEYRLLFEENPLAMFIADRDNMSILEVNSAALSLYGYTRDEFMNLTLKDLRPSEDINLLIKLYNEAISKVGKTQEIRHMKKSGEIFWAEASYYDIEYKGRNARHASVADVTLSKERELMLRESEEKYRLMFEAMVQGVVYQAADGSIMAANKAAERILGLTIDQMLGKTSVDPQWRAIHEDGSDFPGQQHPSMESLRTGKEVKDIIMGVYNPVLSGIKWINVCAVPQFRNGEDKPFQVFSTFEDITEKKTHDDQIMRLNLNLEEKVKQRTAELENFFNVALDLLCIADLDGSFIKVNKAWEYILGYSVEELEKSRFLDFVHPDDMRATLDALVRLGEDKPILAFTNRYRNRSGGYRFVEWHSVPVGKLIYSAARDVTERIESEEKLMKARQEADEANRAKSQFLASMSHEIRTPMNAIMGYSELLEALISDPVQKDFLNSIKTSGKTLLTLINDILDLSKIEAGKMDLEPEPITARPFFSEFAGIFAFKVREKDLTFSTSISSAVPDKIFFDSTRLRQIVLNLVSNAVKFTEKGGVVLRIDSDPCKPEDGEGLLIIEVSDSGIGIAGKDQPMIYDSFFQVKNKFSQSGTGLGLAIATSLVKLMRGTISMESHPGEGSKFTVSLPSMPVPQVAPAGFEPELFDPFRVRFGKAVLMIIDDIDLNRNFIKDVLRNSEIEILEASDGAVVFRSEDIKRADLIITDIKMPNMDGYEMHRRLKTDDRLKDIPVIAYSASVMSYDRDRLASIFDGLLVKPLKIEDLIRELMRFLPFTLRGQDDVTNEPDPASRIDEIADHAGMMHRLRGELSERKKSFEKRQPIRLVGQFAEELRQLGHDHKCPSLEKYGSDLKSAASTFSIATILDLLKRYQQLVDGLDKK
jgi:PAS domain S-box-containing protein